MKKKIARTLLAAGAATAMLTGLAAPALAAPSKDDYRYHKQKIVSIGSSLEDAAWFKLIEEGSPQDRYTFLNEVLTEAVGPAVPVTPVALPAHCAAAVEPLRAMMNKYDSFLAVPTKKKHKLVNVLLRDARVGCDNGKSPDWAHFYRMEFEAWQYSQRGDYQVLWNDNGFKIRDKDWKKYSEFGPLCQKLAFNKDGWLERTSCRK